MSATPPDIVPRAWLTVLWLAISARPSRAVSALVTLVRGKRVRAWNQLCLAAADNPHYYSRWVAVAEPALLPRPSAAAQGLIGAVLLDGDDQRGDDRSVTKASLVRAFGRDLPIFDETMPLPASGRPQWLLPMHAGDIVSPALGTVLADRLCDAAARLVYWDEDRLVAGRRTWPWMKPDWDPLLFGSHDGLTGSCVLRADAIPSGGSIDWAALALATAGEPPSPLHIPLILTHRRQAPVPLARIAGGVPPVSISIIIPTRDQADLLETCMAGLAQTRFPGDHDIIVIDNDSQEPRTLGLLQQLKDSGRARILSQPGPFNFAAMINAGVAAAHGDLVCLLNDDVEIISPDWLERMATWAVREDIGAVGARLLYPNGTLQHAGVALGIGGAAGHVDKGARPAPVEFAPWQNATRTVSAVTAACLLISRAKFIAAGGLDEKNFAVDFNDVDFCLRLGARGLRTVYCADATLIHHESLSRGTIRKDAELVRFERELAMLRERWGTTTIVDPYHSPLFRRQCERCLLAF